MRFAEAAALHLSFHLVQGALHWRRIEIHRCEVILSYNGEAWAEHDPLANA